MVRSQPSTRSGNDVHLLGFESAEQGVVLGRAVLHLR